MELKISERAWSGRCQRSKWGLKAYLDNLFPAINESAASCRQGRGTVGWRKNESHAPATTKGNDFVRMTKSEARVIILDADHITALKYSRIPTFSFACAASATVTRNR